MPKENYMAPGPTQAEFNALDAEVDALNSKMEIYNAEVQTTFANIVSKVTSVSVGAVVGFSGDSSCGTLLTGTAGICFGTIKKASNTRLDYMVTQPNGGRIAIGTINISDSSVSIAKVFS